MKQYHVLVSHDNSVIATRIKTAGVVAYAVQMKDWELHFVPLHISMKQLKTIVSTIKPDGAVNVTYPAAKVLDCPIVTNDVPLTSGYTNAIVTCDESVIGKLAAAHIYHCGFRQCAFIGSNYIFDRTRSAIRYQAFRDELLKLGYKGDVPQIICEYYASMYERTPARLAEWLNSLPKPCGLFVYNDFLCQSVLIACRKAKIKIPEQIGILGVDNEWEICEYSQPTLSSIEPDFFGAGFAAAKLLDGFMREGVPEKPIVQYYGVKKLHTRMSTQNVIGPMKIVAAIRERIRISEGRDISLPLLAKEFGMSRRMLEYRFKNGQGRSISDEIIDARLAAVERLLTNTDMPIGDISFHTGFGTAANLRHAFRKFRNTSLSQYRAEHSITAKSKRS